MSTVEHIQTQTIVGNPNSENFLKKMKKWQHTQRGDNSHLKKLPLGVSSHRGATLKAMEIAGNLNKKILHDNISLETVEQNLHAMNTYVELDNEHSQVMTSKNTVMENSINVEDCIKVKNETIMNVRNMQKSQWELSQATGPTASVFEKRDDDITTSVIASSGLKKAGVLEEVSVSNDKGDVDRGGRPSTGQGGLKLAKLHNHARMKKLKQNKSSTENNNNNNNDGSTFLTGLNVELDSNAQEDRQKGGPPQLPVTSMGALNSSSAVHQSKYHRIAGSRLDDIPLSSDDVHTPPEKSRTQIPRVLQVQLETNKQILETPIELPVPQLNDSSQPLVISKFNHHGSSAPSLTVYDVHAIHSSAMNRQQMASRSKASARRGSSKHDEDVLDEDVAERQLMWLMKVEAKNRAAKREKENKIIEELKIVPNVAQAKASWVKAKQLHAREVDKVKEAEEMKKKLDEMKSEMHHLRVEEKAIRLRRLHQTKQTEIALFAKQNGIPISEPLRKKKKKKKKKDRDPSLENPTPQEQQKVVSDQLKSKVEATHSEIVPQKFQQQLQHHHVPVTARGTREVSSEGVVAGGGVVGIKQLIKNRRPKSANAVMKWSTLKSYDQQNFDVLDMVLSPSHSEDGVFAQLPSSTRRQSSHDVGTTRASKNISSPFRPAPSSSGGWVDNDKDNLINVDKGKESFSVTKNKNNVDVNKKGSESNGLAVTNNLITDRNNSESELDESDQVSRSLHQQYIQQQQRVQQIYLAECPYVPQPHQNQLLHDIQNSSFHDTSADSVGVKSQLSSAEGRSHVHHVAATQNNGVEKDDQKTGPSHYGSDRTQRYPHQSTRNNPKDFNNNNNSLNFNENLLLNAETLEDRMREMSDRQAAIMNRQEERRLQQESARQRHLEAQQAEGLQRKVSQQQQQQVKQHQHMQEQANITRQISQHNTFDQHHRNVNSTYTRLTARQNGEDRQLIKGSDSFKEDDESIYSNITEDRTYSDTLVTRREYPGVTNTKYVENPNKHSFGNVLFENTNAAYNSVSDYQRSGSVQANSSNNVISNAESYSRSGYSSVASTSTKYDTESTTRSDLDSQNMTVQTARTHSSAAVSSIRDHSLSTRFFDQTSTAEKGRFRVHDARDFDTKSMFRKPDLVSDSVTLLMGKKRNSDVIEIVTVLFDRAKFSEEGARIWWEEHRERLLGV